MGTDCSEDLLIVDFPDRPKDSVGGSITEDGSFLVVSTTQSCGATNRLYYYDLLKAGHKIKGKLELKPLFTDNESRYDVGFLKFWTLKIFISSQSFKTTTANQLN
jgi:hypothetical protein